MLTKNVKWEIGTMTVNDKILIMSFSNSMTVNPRNTCEVGGRITLSQSGKLEEDK